MSDQGTDTFTPPSKSDDYDLFFGWESGPGTAKNADITISNKEGSSTKTAHILIKDSSSSNQIQHQFTDVQFEVYKVQVTVNAEDGSAIFTCKDASSSSEVTMTDPSGDFAGYTIDQNLSAGDGHFFLVLKAGAQETCSSTQDLKVTLKNGPAVAWAQVHYFNDSQKCLDADAYYQPTSKPQIDRAFSVPPKPTGVVVTLSGTQEMKAVITYNHTDGTLNMSDVGGAFNNFILLSQGSDQSLNELTLEFVSKP